MSIPTAAASCTGASQLMHLCLHLHRLWQQPGCAWLAVTELTFLDSVLLFYQLLLTRL